MSKLFGRKSNNESEEWNINKLGRHKIGQRKLYFKQI